MAEFSIASAWRDPVALAALARKLLAERVMQLSGFLAELPELPPAGQLEREERSGFAVRATGPPLLADFWHSPALVEWLAQATCERETGALLLARLGAGDLDCVRYVSQLSQGAVRLECAHFELS